MCRCTSCDDNGDTRLFYIKQQRERRDHVQIEIESAEVLPPFGVGMSNCGGEGVSGGCLESDCHCNSSAFACYASRA